MRLLRGRGLRGARARQQPAGRVLRAAGRHALEPAAARARAARLRPPRARHPRPGRACSALVEALRPAAIVHAAAQPSHDRAAAIPFDDFDTNAVGTLNLLEAARRSPARRARSSTCAPTRSTATGRTRSRSRSSRPAGTTPTRAYADGIPETFPIDQSTAQPVRRVQGGGRRDGAGVRPLLRHAHLLPARRLPHRAEPQRRRAARLPELPRASATSRGASTGSSATRASRSATTSTASTWPASSTSSSKSPRCGRGLQPRRRARRTPAAFSRRSRSSRSSPASRSVYTLRREEPRSATTSATTATCARCRQHYPGLGHHRRASRHLRRDRRGLARQARACEDPDHRRVRVRRLDARAAGSSRAPATTLIGIDNFVRPGSEMNRLALRDAGRRGAARRPAAGERLREPARRRRGRGRRRQPERAGGRRRAHLQPPARRAQPARDREPAGVLPPSPRGLRAPEHEPRLLHPRRSPSCRSRVRNGAFEPDTGARPLPAGLTPRGHRRSRSRRPRPSRCTARPSWRASSSRSSTATRSASRSGSTAAACSRARDSSGGPTRASSPTG